MKTETLEVPAALPQVNKLLKLASHYILLFLFALILNSCVSASDVPKAQREPLPSDAQKALLLANTVTIYSVQPVNQRIGKGSFHGHEILGSAELKGEEAKKAIMEYRNGIALWAGGVAGCVFQPRHALRIVSDDGHTYDFLVCFHCLMISLYKDEAYYWSGNVGGKPDALNELLVLKHLPLAK